jgi:hypothetical protein
MHPTDPTRVAFRCSDGSHLAFFGPTNPEDCAHVVVRPTEAGPFYWYIRYTGEEYLGKYTSISSSGKEDEGRAMCVLISPYPIVSLGEKGQNHYLCGDLTTVTVSAAWLDIHSAMSREWVIVWYQPKWPSLLAQLYAELETVSYTLDRADNANSLRTSLQQMLLELCDRSQFYVHI